MAIKWPRVLRILGYVSIGVVVAHRAVSWIKFPADVVEVFGWIKGWVIMIGWENTLLIVGIALLAASWLPRSWLARFTGLKPPNKVIDSSPEMLILYQITVFAEKVRTTEPKVRLRSMTQQSEVTFPHMLGPLFEASVLDDYKRVLSEAKSSPLNDPISVWNACMNHLWATMSARWLRKSEARLKALKAQYNRAQRLEGAASIEPPRQSTPNRSDASPRSGASPG
jgi:hypothetical protein